MLKLSGGREAGAGSKGKEMGTRMPEYSGYAYKRWIDLGKTKMLQGIRDLLG